VTLGIGTSDGVLWRRLWNFRIHPNTYYQVGFSQYSVLGHGSGDGMPRPSPCPSGIHWGVSNPRLILSSLSNSRYRRTLCHVRFEVSKALVTVITIFCCVTPCGLLMCTNLRINIDDASNIFQVSAMYSVKYISHERTCNARIEESPDEIRGLRNFGPQWECVRHVRLLSQFCLCN
jgi:hypothetical protein